MNPKRFDAGYEEEQESLWPRIWNFPGKLAGWIVAPFVLPFNRIFDGD